MSIYQRIGMSLDYDACEALLASGESLESVYSFRNGTFTVIDVDACAPTSRDNDTVVPGRTGDTLVSQK